MKTRVRDWGFALAAKGSLAIGGSAAGDLARTFGTPLHVIDEDGLRRRARSLRNAFAAAWPGDLDLHFAMKCNSTPGIVRIVLEEGFFPEVGTPYEWELARRLGVDGAEIIVNGPNKGCLIEDAVREGAILVADGPEDLEAILRASEVVARRRRDARLAADPDPRVLLRVNPDCVPKGMNRATATGSRRASVFGFDLAAGEVERALERLAAVRGKAPLRYAGLHCHVGTGIGFPGDYRRPLMRLLSCASFARRLGLFTEILDIGGGIGVPTSREMSTPEFLIYQGIGHLPGPSRPDRFPEHEEFAQSVCRTIHAACVREGLPLPRLVVEPGRSVVSGAGVLLVTIGRIKERRGAGVWAITDGGAGTVAFPLHYEVHEVLLCRDPEGERSFRYNIVGSACHSADTIYKGKRMPRLEVGDVLAVCDAGAYFTVQECNFGFPRPPIVSVRGGQARLLRRRETFEDMTARDIDWEAEAAHGSAQEVRRGA